MTQSRDMAERIIAEAASHGSLANLCKQLEPVPPGEQALGARIPAGNDFSSIGLQRRQHFLRERGLAIDALAQGLSATPECLQGNIENLIGFSSIPVGLIGPLRVNGLAAKGDFYVPMATTEGALVASYHRGAYVISQAGGATSICVAESISRAPSFAFANIRDAGMFIAWVLPQFEQFHDLVRSTTSHGRLLSVDMAFNGKVVNLIFNYDTGDAAGQNMVTVATESICNWIVDNTPVKPEQWFLEGNMSGDKKGTMQSFIRNRGRKVVAEAVLPARIVQRFLNTTPEQMAFYCKLSTHGGILSGSIGVQGHYANALAAIFIACGQDVACTAEASLGLTDMEVKADGALYVSVSLPNLVVGTVGGGTHLPTARECLGLMDCVGDGKARKFAEICAATVLAGEISIIGALSAGDFGRAHATFRHRDAAAGSSPPVTRAVSEA